MTPQPSLFTSQPTTPLIDPDGRPTAAYWRKRIIGVEVYRFRDDEVLSNYLLVIIYRADFGGWEPVKSYRLYGRRQRRYWQMVDAMRRAWDTTGSRP